MRFKDQVVIVTGGASGIGKAAVRKFHQEGASVVLADINDELAAALLEELKSPRAVYRRTDITDEGQARVLTEETAAASGGASTSWSTTPPSSFSSRSTPRWGIGSRCCG
jgi:NAD(P)-dependent dehydrogenase (short-subunit alcohol dehydrogenase family)